MKRNDFNSVLLSTALLFAPVIIISTITLTVFLSAYKKLDMRNIYESQQTILALQKKKTETSFQGIFSDLLFLKHNNVFLQYLNDPYKNAYYVNQLFFTFCRNKKIYNQIRLLDADGKEELRINYNNGDTTIVPPSELADKSMRYYFQNAVNLNENTVFISRLDLNIENNVIEKPYNPTIRFSSPVFDYDGELRGVLVFNYMAKEILRSISDYESLSLGTIALLDHEGNWLLSDDKSEEFAFMFGSGKTFPAKYPEIWNEVYLKEHGTYSNSKIGIFFYNTIRPVPTLASEESDIIDLSFSSELQYMPAGYEWKLVMCLSREFLAERYKHLETFSTSVYIVVNLSLLFASFVIAYIRRKHKSLQEEHYREIKESSKRLKKQVEQTQELVHILCHDLVNPIGCVMGIMELIDDEKVYDEHYSKLISLSLSEALDIVNLVRTMRALDEGKKNLELEPVSLQDAVSTSLTLIKSKAENKDIRLNTDIPSDIHVLAEKTSLINSVINNLLTNAIKFSERGSEIEITSETDGEHLILKVRDYGKGIPQKMINDLFDGSKPTSRPGTEGETGTGYGMPLVKKFMNRYNGDITISSVEQKDGTADHGTEVSLIFKLS